MMDQHSDAMQREPMRFRIDPIPLCLENSHRNSETASGHRLPDNDNDVAEASHLPLKLLYNTIHQDTWFQCPCLL